MYEDTPHNLESGDYVMFKEVKGMEEINGLPAVPIRVTGRFTFEINLDTRTFHAYNGGGHMIQVKQDKHVVFNSLSRSITHPEFVTSDFAKMDRQRPILLMFRALDAFRNSMGRSPNPRNEVGGDQFVISL